MSAVAAPMPVANPMRQPPVIVRRMQSSPIGPTGAAIEKPTARPSRPANRVASMRTLSAFLPVPARDSAFRWTGSEATLYTGGAMSGTPFIKMHGLGNDFVVLDARAHAIVLDDARARAIA